MSSQIYARYVPPTKKKVSGVSSESVLPSDSTPQPTIPSISAATQPDASSTYTRYIPPSKSKVRKIEGPEEEPSSTSKRKREIVDADQVGPSKKPKKTARGQESSSAAEERLGKSNGSSEATAEIVAKPDIKSKKHKRKVNEDDMPKDLETKIKKKTSRSGPEPGETEARIEVEEDDARKTSPTRKKKKAVIRGDVTDEGAKESRHERLMRKREKSRKKAEKLAETENHDADEVGLEPEELHDLVPLPQPEPVPEASSPTEEALPSWISSPIQVKNDTTADFSEFGLEEKVITKLQSKGFKEAFAVQAAVLPLLLPAPTRLDGDVVVSAATGSGKTLAYVLPMIKDISRHRVSKLRGLIVLPTRELVSQAKEVANMCSAAFGKTVKIGTAVGSDIFAEEQAKLMQQELVYDPEGHRELVRNANEKWKAKEDYDGGFECLLEEVPIPRLPDHVERSSPRVNVLICTPGRLVEHVKNTPGFTLQELSWLVVDEADKLLDQSYQLWLDVVMEQLPKPCSMFDGGLRKVILSATMTRDIGQLTQLKLYRPKLVVLEGEVTSATHVVPSLLVESAIKVEEDSLKPLYLMELLRRERIISEDDQSSTDSDSESSNSEAAADVLRGVLVFTKSNEAAVRLGRLMALLAPASGQIGVLTSALPRASRLQTLKRFSAGKVSVLVASDLMSRGLDLANLAHVVNYDVPSSLTSYIHRIGRTARAGRGGHAWTLFTASEGRWFWQEIGRSELVQRGKVERVNIKMDVFDDTRGTYEMALDTLAKEASRIV